MSSSSRVFVSATSADLSSFRRAVRDKLLDMGVHPILQDHFAPDYRTVKDVLRSKITDCDSVICLLGNIYGQEPTTREPGQPRRSYSQMEYDIAIGLSKPVFIFKADGTCSFDPHQHESKELQALQAEHVRRLTSTDQIWKCFRTVDELTQQIGIVQFEKSGGRVAVKPKGLRSFDASDSDFILELLPGPRDKSGLPDSIGFWKHRIEANGEPTFTVGVIYGPSGCGKSSLVKAGLLPRLSHKIVAVYVECASDDTEVRLLNGLRKHVPRLPRNLDLPQAIGALRRGQYLAKNHKVLVVVDQFEQWLHANRKELNTGLAQVLKTLEGDDGDRFQCLVMVRDDFWMAFTRFLKIVNVRLSDDKNADAVDLFDRSHARSVLVKFGRAYGRLRADPEPLSEDETTFLDRVVEGLTPDGRVVSIRLALFAEMVKSRPWIPATLEEVGGLEGVGVRFLDETFHSAALRHHRQAAESVLRALLPETGTDIKGRRRSRDELREAAAVDAVSEDFDELLRILDGETRLITLTDAETTDGVLGRNDASRTPETSRNRKHFRAVPHYQLTHDYLVHSLRTWLTSRQQQTRRGRAGLRLTERAALWNDKPENRRLPSLLEYLSIRVLTHRVSWTEPQHKMICAADRFHLTRGIRIVLILALVTWGGWQINGWIRGADAVDALIAADIGAVPDMVVKIQKYRGWAAPRLRQIVSDKNSNAKERLHASLALVPADPDQIDYLYTRLLAAAPDQIQVVVSILDLHSKSRKSELVDRLWNALDDPDAGEEQRLLCAASALATLAPTDKRWSLYNESIAHQLANVSPYFATHWINCLRPIGNGLLPFLARICRGPGGTEFERFNAVNVLSEFASDNPDVLASMIMDLDERQFPVIFTRLELCQRATVEYLEKDIDRLATSIRQASSESDKERLARQQANTAVCLVRLGAPEKAWPLLRYEAGADPQPRSYFVHQLKLLGASHQELVRRLDQEQDPSSRRALLLALGEFTDFPASERPRLVEHLLDIYEHEVDSGIHSATRWLLTRWDQQDVLQKLDFRVRVNERELRSRNSSDKRQWYISTQGLTMMILKADEFEMGSPDSESDRHQDEIPHRRHIGRTFAIASTEITRDQYSRFLAANPDMHPPIVDEFSRESDSPQIRVDWYSASRYCNWLSETEGILSDQWCYEPAEFGLYAEGMKPADRFLERTGYRLPTEAEWEFACRSGTATSRYFGFSVELLPKYAWYLENADYHAWPAGRLKPNEFGLFDMLGSVYEWCHDRYREYPDRSERASDDPGDLLVIDGKSNRVLRGGSFGNPSRILRSAFRCNAYGTEQISNFVGFRPVRTYN